MANKHVTHLEKLLDHLRGERRKLAEKMATGKNMPKSFTKLIDLQSESDALKRAIKDEKKGGAKGAAHKAAREKVSRAAEEAEGSQFLPKPDDQEEDI